MNSDKIRKLMDGWEEVRQWVGGCELHELGEKIIISIWIWIYAQKKKERRESQLVGY